MIDHAFKGVSLPQPLLDRNGKRMGKKVDHWFFLEGQTHAEHPDGWCSIDADGNMTVGIVSHNAICIPELVNRELVNRASGSLDLDAPTPNELSARLWQMMLDFESAGLGGTPAFEHLANAYARLTLKLETGR